MSSRVNTETNDPHGAVEKRVSIEVVGSTLQFTVMVPKYIYLKLTEEDWMDAGRILRTNKDAIVSRAVISGSFFGQVGRHRVNEDIAQAMKDIIRQKFLEHQIKAGEERWHVPSLLAGERYA